MMRLQNGFTLIEMVMVILVLSIIVGMAGSLLSQGLNTFSAGENIIDANWQGQIGMERMIRDILGIRSVNDISSASASTLSFTNTNGDTLSYTLSGTSITLTQNGSSAVLADGVQSLAFNYYDQNGSVTATPTAIRYVQITMNVTKNNVNYLLTTRIYPRNLQ
jgi:prepilin-type N-terminal cleavage/methylation domain-containing protein